MHIPPIPLVPVSASQIIVGSVLGIGLAKGGKNIRYNMLGKISIAWVTAPLIAFFFSFVALFIVQNVFEQTVNVESHYVFDRTTISAIEKLGYDSKYLSTVNGRSFENELSLYKELKAQSNFDKEQLLDILATTEIFPMTVDSSKLQQHRMKFTAAQLQTLEALNGTSYRHKWQLAQALEKHPCWQQKALARTKKAEAYNHNLQSLMDLLYSSFHKPGTAK